MGLGGRAVDADEISMVDGAASEAAEVTDLGIGEVGWGGVEMFGYEWRAFLKDGICLNGGCSWRVGICWKGGCVDLRHCLLV